MSKDISETIKGHLNKKLMKIIVNGFVQNIINNVKNGFVH